ncbi:MAG TPA: AAA family ATPase, partial [Polyangiales bacterium]
MKFKELTLSAFGPFTGKQLAFSDKPLSLIYGPNEAGKSTTLRALTSLLYGIDARTTDAHAHDMSKLRIGATLLDTQGQPLTVVRRKGSKNTLLDAEGQPLADDLLAPLLGGLDEKLFRQMFGLDHERLREGAEALLQAGGQLGEVLFDASTGGRSVHQVLEQLRAEAEALYKARGRTPALNVALDALKQQKAARNDAMLSPQAFVDQQAALQEARAERERAAAERMTWAAEKARLTRLLSLLPLLAKRDQHAEELAKLGESVEVAEAPVREFEQRLAQLIAGERELPAARLSLAAHEREIAQLTARLGSGAGLHGLDTASKARLRGLVEARALLRREDAERARRSAELQAETGRVEAALRALPEPLPGALAALVTELERDDLVARLSRVRNELQQGRAQLSRRLAPLGLTSVSGPLPADEELAALESTFDHVERERARCERAIAECDAEQGRLARARDELLARGALVTRAELLEVRRERDLALDTLLAGGPAAAQLRAHAALNERADVLADRMVDEAQRMAELAGVELALAKLTRARAEHVQSLSTLKAEGQGARDRYRALLAPWQLAERAPRAARSALAELVALRTLSAELDVLVDEERRLCERAAERAAELRHALDARDEALDVLLREARQRLTGEAERGRERARLGALRERLHEEDTRLAARARVIEHELSQLEVSYREQLGERGLTLSPEELVACFDDLAQLAQHLRAAEVLRARAAALQAERARLTADAGCADQALELHVEQLVRKARERVQAERDRVRLRAELAKLDDQIALAADGQPLATLRAELAGLSRDEARARLLELDELLEAAAQRIGDLDQRIGSLSAGMEHLTRESGAAE